jgi:hypothetical protein
LKDLKARENLGDFGVDCRKIVHDVFLTFQRNMLAAECHNLIAQRHGIIPQQNGFFTCINS